MALLPSLPAQRQDNNTPTPTPRSGSVSLTLNGEVELQHNIQHLKGACFFLVGEHRPCQCCRWEMDLYVLQGLECGVSRGLPGGYVSNTFVKQGITLLDLWLNVLLCQGAEDDWIRNTVMGILLCIGLIGQPQLPEKNIIHWPRRVNNLSLEQPAECVCMRCASVYLCANVCVCFI